MTVKYLDPYKDDKYGKLKGDKSESYFGVTFKEAIVHKTDDAYIIAGYVTKYTGITRSFKPELTLEPGLCAVPIYGKEYEIRKKDKDDKWTSEKITPSLFEKALYEVIKKNEDDWMPHNAAISLELTHVPNGMLQGKSEAELSVFVSGNVKYAQIDLFEDLPEYTPPSNNYKGKGGGESWGLSPDQRMDFIKKQLQADIKADGYKQGRTLAELVDQMILEHADNENFISIYYDLLIACVK